LETDTSNQQERETRGPGYFAIIPATVRYDKNVQDGAKLLYAEITALAEQRGYCWASNAYFADLYQTSVRTIQRWISTLEKCGHIKTSVTFVNGSQQVDERHIRIPKPSFLPASGDQGGGDKNVTGGTESTPEHDEGTPYMGYGDKNVRGWRQKCQGGGDKNVMDTSKFDLAAAAAPDFSEKTENLKHALSKIDPLLVFDGKLCLKMADYLDRSGLPPEFCAFVFKQTAAKKPKDLRALFLTLFFADDYRDLFRAAHKPPPPPVPAECPVCRAVHDSTEKSCPVCGFQAGGDIERARRVYALPEEQKAEYEKRCMAITFGKDNLLIRMSLLADLNREFGISS
jgi:hypothetical protein